MNLNNYFSYYKFIVLLFILAYLGIFILEIFYYLPSPTADDLWFLKVTFNICRDNSFVVTKYNVFEHNAEPIKYITHGWFGPYVMAKLNIDCSIRGLFFINFLIKIFTTVFLFFHLKKIKLNDNLSIIILFITLLVQLKIQFRLETFVILIYTMLFYFFFNKKYFISGIISSFIFFSQPTLFVIIGLLGLIIYFNLIKKNLLYLFIGYLIGLLLLLNLYPYTFFEYLAGLWDHRGAIFNNETTLLVGGLNQSYLHNLYKYYIIEPFIPLWGILIILLIFLLVKLKPALIITLPILFLFGPNIPSSNYVLISLIPFFMLIYINLSHKEVSIGIINRKLFILVLIISFLGLSQYFSRNILTSIYHSDKFNITKTFLLSNINNIKIFPGFAFMLDDKLKFLSNGDKFTNNTDYKYNTYSINGSLNPCPENNIRFNEPSLKINKFKIYNSNSGYGIWICKIKE